jgi:HEAT repeat protein
VNVDTWRDAALILGRLESPLASTLTVYLERAGAADALIEAGDVVVPPVNDVLRVGGPTRRRLAAQVLGAIGVPAARDALERALKTESDPSVKGAIGDALAHSGRRPPPAEIR